MQAIITVFKDEFKEKEEVKKITFQFSQEIKEVGNAYTFSPKPGKLFEFLNLLRDNKISYGTHFNTADSDTAK